MGKAVGYTGRAPNPGGSGRDVQVAATERVRGALCILGTLGVNFGEAFMGYVIPALVGRAAGCELGLKYAAGVRTSSPLGR